MAPTIYIMVALLQISWIQRTKANHNKKQKFIIRTELLQISWIQRTKANHNDTLTGQQIDITVANIVDSKN